MRTISLRLVPLVLAFASALVAGDALAQDAPASCFWSRPWNAETNNVYYQDRYATYWLARFVPPAGARVVLRGAFPHARYMSLTAYKATQTVMGLPDHEIEPEPGSVNPFRPGASRRARARAYAVAIAPAPVPPAEQREPNVLYTDAPPGVAQEVMLRVYVPDRGYGWEGGGALPELEVTLADGTTLSGEPACEAIAANPPIVASPPPPFTAEQYNALKAQAGEGPLWPALPTPAWRTYFNFSHTVCVLRGLECDPNPPKNSGTYPNPDNDYVYASIHRGYGPVLEITARRATTPRTFARKPVMGEGDLRYWSLCTMEGLATTRTVECRFDEEFPVRADGLVSLVLSRPEDRPRNAEPRCGHLWMAWPPEGDGAGDPDAGVIFLRHMLPADDFAYAAHFVTKPGEEREVLGPFYPTATYRTVAEFEARGCRRAPARLPILGAQARGRKSR